MKKRNITLLTAIAAAAAFASSAQATITANTGEFASWDKTVDGVTGNWSAFTNLGGRSTGTLEITNVGLGKEADMVSGGNVSWGNATITVTGSGAKLLMDSLTVVFGAGQVNTVNVTDGGLIATANYQLGAQGTSITTVSGAGSTLTATTRLQIGRNGTGSSAILSLVGGGLAKTTQLQFAEDDGSGGYVQMGIGGVLAVSGDKTGLTQAALFANGGLFSLNGGTRFGEIQYDAGAGFVNMTGATEGVDYSVTYETTGDYVGGYTVLTLIGGTPPAADPEITSITWGSPNATIEMKGVNGTTYTCDSSTDLVNWTLGVVTDPASIVPVGGVFTFDVVAGDPKKFYRIAD